MNKYTVDLAGMRVVQIASMEKPELDAKFINNAFAIACHIKADAEYQLHIRSLPSYPLQSVPEGWVQDMVVAPEDFEIGWQVYDDELRQWEDCAEWYYNSINGVRRIIAIPILKTGITIAPAADKGEEKFYAVEYAGFWHIQKTPYYESLEEGTNILNAEEVGYRESEQYANLIAELLNKHYEK